MADESIKERAKLGKDLLNSQKAQGEAGQKQPEHKVGIEDVQGTVEKLAALEQELGAETYKSSAERAQESGNLNPTPPHERSIAQVANTSRQPIDAAVGHIAAAKTALETGAVADARLLSDPRYENDQKIFELAQQGKLQAAITADPSRLVESGVVSPEVAETLPTSTVEQAEKDKEKLEKIETEVAPINSGITPSTSDSEKEKDKSETKKEGTTIK